MPNIKTAISIQEQLFKQAGALARELKLSRSGLFAVALEEFIARHQALELLNKINEAYDKPSDAGERKYRKAMRRRHRKTIEGQW